MRKETVVGITAALILASLIYLWLVSRESIEEFRRGRTTAEVITLRRRPSPKPGFLSEVSRPAVTASSVPPAPSFDSSSPCGILLGDTRDADSLFDIFTEGSRSPENDLFRALNNHDWRAVAEADRFGGSPDMEGVALLARLGFIGDEEEFPIASVDPIDIDRLAVMRASDPTNAFWPMLEVSLLKREGIPVEPARLLEIAKLRNYENPLSNFYGGFREEALSDDRKYAAYTAIYRSAPILGVDFMRPFNEEAKKEDPEINRVIAKIGKIIVASQLSEGMPDGFRGNFFNAWQGQWLIQKAEHRTDKNHAAYRALAEKFGIGSEDFVTIENGKSKCDLTHFHAYLEKVRAKVRASPI